MSDHCVVIHKKRIMSEKAKYIYKSTGDLIDQILGKSPAKQEEQKPTEIKPTTNGAGKQIIEEFYNDMDNNNKKAMDVMATQGMDAAVKHMFTHPKTGKPMTYGEMRSLYG